MSTPNPTYIIAEHMCSYHGPSNADRVSYCWCGWSGEDHAEHVVSKLTDAGYSITPTPPLTAEQRDPDGNHIFDQGCDLAVCIECGVTRSEHQRARAAAAERDTNG